VDAYLTLLDGTCPEACVQPKSHIECPDEELRNSKNAESEAAKGCMNYTEYTSVQFRLGSGLTRPRGDAMLKMVSDPRYHPS
jgi:hypothetical protein